MVTLKEVFKNYVKQLQNNLIENPEREVTLLLSFGLNIAAHNLHFQSNRAISNSDLVRINQLIGRREKKEPIAKIIGKKNFWNSSFLVSKAVLDPRPETELLVETVLNYSGIKRKILDLGTGSGCIAISLALEINDAKVVGVDISEVALRMARKNSQLTGANVCFLLSNWFQNVSETFDIIVSNPPYVSEKAFKELPEDVKNYDPRIALIGGVDGLENYRRIACSFSSYLNKGGVGFFEIGCGQKKGVIDIFKLAGLSVFDIKQDLNGLDRVICVKKDA